MFRQVDAGFAATLYKYGRGATWGGLVMITAKWDRGQGVPRARERPAPAASPPLACSRLRWRGSEQTDVRPRRVPSVVCSTSGWAYV